LILSIIGAFTPTLFHQIYGTVSSAFNERDGRSPMYATHMDGISSLNCNVQNAQRMFHQVSH
jgi:hypothetical protein